MRQIIFAAFVFLVLLLHFTEGGLNSLTDCQAVALAFSNTCAGAPSTAATSVSTMTGATVNCTGQLSCVGTRGAGGTCAWSRKLCVTCRSDNGVTKIRVQTNALPDHCYQTPSTTTAAQNIDFEVIFNQDVTTSSGVPVARSGVSPNDQTSVTNMLCGDPNSINTNSDAASISSLTFTAGDTTMQTAVGISINGVVMLNQMSANRVDPFYFASWSGATSTNLQAEDVDQCLGHPNNVGIYHYHLPSPCQVSTSSYRTTPQACSDISSCANNWAK